MMLPFNEKGGILNQDCRDRPAAVRIGPRSAEKSRDGLSDSGIEGPMREEYHIISDGSCDLPPELVQEKNITVVPFYVSFDDKKYLKEGVDIGVRDFYQQMVDRKGVYPKSCMPGIRDYEEVFLPYAKEGLPVICICITTKFSGSMQTALNAREMVLETYPEAKITVIDATVNTVLQGLYVLEAVKLRDSGVPYEDAVRRLEEIRSTGRIFFTVGDMEYLKHGGRIGKVAAVAGSVLGIRPVITLKQGEIFPSGIGRSRRKTTEKSLELLVDYLKASKLSADCYSLALGFGYDYQEAVEYRAHVLETLHKNGFAVEEFPIYQIGAGIGVHTGPYPLGLGIIEKAMHD